MSCLSQAGAQTRWLQDFLEPELMARLAGDPKSPWKMLLEKSCLVLLFWWFLAIFGPTFWYLLGMIFFIFSRVLEGKSKVDKTFEGVKADIFFGVCSWAQGKSNAQNVLYVPNLPIQSFWDCVSKVLRCCGSWVLSTEAWFCLRWFFILGLTKRPFGDYFLFF